MPKLIDGREVPSDSEEWRHECECRAIAALPTLADRRAWLERLEKQRGLSEVGRIRDTMKKLWEPRQP